MDGTTFAAALVGALGPTLAGLAAWRAAVGTRKEVTTNNGRRAGDYIESIGKLTTDFQIHRLQQAAKDDELQRQIARLREDDQAQFAEVDARLEAIEQAVCPDQPLRVHRGHSGL